MRQAVNENHGNVQFDAQRIIIIYPKTWKGKVFTNIPMGIHYEISEKKKNRSHRPYCKYQ